MKKALKIILRALPCLVELPGSRIPRHWLIVDFGSAAIAEHIYTANFQ